MRQEQLTKQEKRKAAVIAWIIVAGLIAVTALALMFRNGMFPQRIAVADERAEVTEAAKAMDSVSVRMTLDPARQAQLSATQELTLTNRTGQAQRTIVLRSWTGAFLREDTSPVAGDDSCYPDGFSAGGVTVELASVNGEPVNAAWKDDARTVLVLTPSEAWQPGETVTVRLAWQAVVPDCASRFGVRGGTYALGSVIPVPAIWNGTAWAEDAYEAVGDPFQYSECMNWQVELTMPQGFSAAATGWCEPVTESGKSVCRWNANAVRDFTICVSSTWSLARDMEGDVMIAAYAQDRKRAERMVKYARQALRLYASLWGDYVYPTLTLCEVDFPYSGMEYARLIMMGTDTVNGAADSLEWSIAHETAHQWWSIMTGSDSVRQAWQDETLCVYAMLRYVEQWVGSSAAKQAANTLVSLGERASLGSGLTPGCPLGYFTGMDEYTQIVYDRGVSLWLSLEKLTGRDALDAALKDYAGKWRFRTAGRADLTALLTQHLGGAAEGLMTEVLDTVYN